MKNEEPAAPESAHKQEHSFAIIFAPIPIILDASYKEVTNLSIQIIKKHKK
jgi:hypothetical protein